MHFCAFKNCLINCLIKNCLINFVRFLNCYICLEAVPDYTKLSLTQAKRFEMESQVSKHSSLFYTIEFQCGLCNEFHLSIL